MAFTDFDGFVQGYLECALWSTHDDVRDPEGCGPMLDENYGMEDIAPEALTAIREELRGFVDGYMDDLSAYCDEMGPWHGTDSRGYCEDPPEARAGHDFWLTRNGHGAGFWDRGLGALGDRLAEASKSYGESYIYAGDDGKLYVS